MNIQCSYKEGGEVHTLPELYSSAWDECIESHIMDKTAWTERAVQSVQDVARYELTAEIGGRVVGAMVIALEGNDPHVGECATVMYNYVLPEYRNIGIAKHFLRAAVALTKSAGMPVLAYTHRVGAGKYLTTYRNIHG